MVIAKSPSKDGELLPEPEKPRPAVLVTGRGTDIAFNLNEDAPLEEVVKELDSHLAGQSTLFSQGGISVNTGNRRLTDDEEEEIRTIFRDRSGLSISRFISSKGQDPGLLSDGNADETPGTAFSNGHIAEVPGLKVEDPPVRRTRKESTSLAEFSSADLARALGGLSSQSQRTRHRAMIVRGTIRSGESVFHNGDIVVLGDVNPGSEVIADGDIIVMGSLKGLPHAGAGGDSKAAIIALSIAAPRLRIGNCEANAPAADGDSGTAKWKKQPVDPQPKFAYVRRGTVYVSPFAGRFADTQKGYRMKGRTIVITSGKGGVGKTTATANLGSALAMRGHRVVVIDTDIGLRNLDVIMGLENRIVYDLVNVIEGRCRLRQAMIQDKHRLELYLIPAAQTRDKDSITPSQLKALCAELEEEYDYILIDCPAGIEQGFKNAVAAAGEAIIVTTPEVSAIRDADRVIGLLDASGLHRPRLIINRISADMVKRGDMMGQEDVESLLAVEVIGLVPADERTVAAANRGIPAVHDNRSSAGAAFVRIAARIDGEDIPLMEIDTRNGMFSKLRDMVGIKGRAYSHA